VASVPLLSSRLPEPLGQRVRRLLRLLIPGDELLVRGRSDGEAITAERSHLDRGVTRSVTDRPVRRQNRVRPFRARRSRNDHPRST